MEQPWALFNAAPPASSSSSSSSGVSHVVIHQGFTAVREVIAMREVVVSKGPMQPKAGRASTLLQFFKARSRARPASAVAEQHSAQG